jgi:putative spermidine/putrescine transport system permease protein
MNATLVLPAAARPRLARRVSDLLYTRRGLWLLALLAPPLLWFGVIYLGSLFALLANASSASTTSRAVSCASSR